MRSLNVSLGASLLPSFSLLSRTSAAMEECNGKVCLAVVEYCSPFTEGCASCSDICDTSSHNYHADQCSKMCADYSRFEPLKESMERIQTQQTLTNILIILLIVLMAIRYVYKFLKWLRHKRCFTLLLRKLQFKHYGTGQNGQDLGGTTIQNTMTINDIERAPSQIYSVTGAEGSVVTTTTPVSTRYPAENSTTPTTLPTEYSYDNQALAVTPVSEKPNGTPHHF